MSKTRVETVDERLRELGYPDANYVTYHDTLLEFARNFAAEADRQQAEIERLQQVISTTSAHTDEPVLGDS